MNKGQRSEDGLGTGLADELIAEALRSVEKHERRKGEHHHEAKEAVDLETTVENIVVPEELLMDGPREGAPAQADDVAQALTPPEPPPPVRRAPEIPASALALIERLKLRTAELTREVESLSSSLNDKTAEAQKHYERLLWTTAELENIKKRHAREKAEVEKYGGERIVREILPVLDNLERAVKHAGEADATVLLEGVQLTMTQFLNNLRRVGVTRIELEPGMPFDPAVHEAMMHEESAELPPNSVAREMQAGYLLHDRLLRASLVTVAKPPANRPAPSSPAAPAESESPAGESEAASSALDAAPPSEEASSLRTEPDAPSAGTSEPEAS